MKRTCLNLLGASLAIFLFSANRNESSWQRSPQVAPTIPGNQNIKTETYFGKMPLVFIPNQGQVDEQVAYYVQGKDTAIYFTPGGITFALTEQAESNTPIHRLAPKRSTPEISSAAPKEEKPTTTRWVVKLEFIGADKNVKPLGEAETGGVVSYFRGRPNAWQTGIPTYSRIIYRNLWPDIDLVYYGTVNRLKYEFIAHPGADPSKIRLAYRGAESVLVDENGRLQVRTPAGGISDDAPLAYQDLGGERVIVSLAYQLGASAGLYGFEVGAYDRSQTLVLDPAFLIYCGYIGGSSDDSGSGIAVDGSGNAYVTGYTGSLEATFPVAVGPDLTFNDNFDAFVAKINAAGTALVYCGYLGGSGDDYGSGIAVDGSGNAYVTGTPTPRKPPSRLPSGRT